MTVRVKFEIRDLWIGVFWERKNRWIHSRFEKGRACDLVVRDLRIYVCLLPMIPIILTFKAKAPA